MGSERAFLKARQQTIDLESKVGKIEVINPTSVEGAVGAGFFCEVCSSLLKDSTSYLDHINGKKRKYIGEFLYSRITVFNNCLDQRALGFSMRVERATTDKVKERIELLKRKINDQKTAPATSALDDYDNRLATQVAEQEKQKRQRKEEMAAKKKEKEAAEVEEMDPEIAAMMGFGGFGGSKK